MNTDAELQMCQDFIINLSVEAGRMINSGFFQKHKTFSTKTSRFDLVTETDAAVEKFVISSIRAKFPHHVFIGEESSTSVGQLPDEPTWMIDPIDGTMNFVHSNPNICISIGLLVDKLPVLGVIYNPVTDELYTARRGHGAYRNGQPIHVSNIKEMAQSIVLAGFGKDLLQLEQSIFSKIVHNVHGVRNNGSVALHMASVACGASDASYDFKLHCWDMAAGTVIVQEAGGVVVDPSGNDLDILSRRFLCAATSELAAELSTHLNNHSFKLERD